MQARRLAAGGADLDDFPRRLQCREGDAPLVRSITKVCRIFRRLFGLTSAIIEENSGVMHK